MVQAKARPVSSDSSLARALADLVEGQRAISLWCRALEQATLWEDYRLRKLLGAWLALAKLGDLQKATLDEVHEEEQNEGKLGDALAVSVDSTASSKQLVQLEGCAAGDTETQMVSSQSESHQVPARLQKYGKMPAVQATLFVPRETETDPAVILESLLLDKEAREVADASAASQEQLEQRTKSQAAASFSVEEPKESEEADAASKAHIESTSAVQKDKEQQLEKERRTEAARAFALEQLSEDMKAEFTDTAQALAKELQEKAERAEKAAAESKARFEEKVAISQERQQQDGQSSITDVGFASRASSDVSLLVSDNFAEVNNQEVNSVSRSRANASEVPARLQKYAKEQIEIGLQSMSVLFRAQPKSLAPTAATPKSQQEMSEVSQDPAVWPGSLRQPAAPSQSGQQVAQESQGPLSSSEWPTQPSNPKSPRAIAEVARGPAAWPESPTRPATASKSEQQVAQESRSPFPPSTSSAQPPKPKSGQEIGDVARGPAAWPASPMGPTTPRKSEQQVAQSYQSPLPSAKSSAQPATPKSLQETADMVQSPAAWPTSPMGPATPIKSEQQVAQEGHGPLSSPERPRQPANPKSPRAIAEVAWSPGAWPASPMRPATARKSEHQVAQEKRGPLPPSTSSAQPATPKSRQETAELALGPAAWPTSPIGPTTPRKREQQVAHGDQNPLPSPKSSAQPATAKSLQQLAREDPEQVPLPTPTTPKSPQRISKEEYESKLEMRKAQINVLNAKRLEMNAELQRQAELSEKFAEQLAKDEAARKQKTMEREVATRQRSLQLFEAKLQKLQDEATQNQNHRSKASQAPPREHALPTSSIPDLNMDTILARLENNSRAQMEVAVSPRGLSTPDKLQEAQSSVHPRTWPRRTQFPHQMDDHASTSLELRGMASDNTGDTSIARDGQNALQIDRLERHEMSDKIDDLQTEVLAGPSETHEDMMLAKLSTIRRKPTDAEVHRMPFDPSGSGKYDLNATQNESIANSANFRSSEPHQSVTQSTKVFTTRRPYLDSPNHIDVQRSQSQALSASAPACTEHGASKTAHATSPQCMDSDMKTSFAKPEICHGDRHPERDDYTMLKGQWQQSVRTSTLPEGDDGAGTSLPGVLQSPPQQNTSTYQRSEGTAASQAERDSPPNFLNSLQSPSLTPQGKNEFPGMPQKKNEANPSGSLERFGSPADVSRDTGCFSWPGMDTPSLVESPQIRAGCETATGMDTPEPQNRGKKDSSQPAGNLQPHPDARGAEPFTGLQPRQDLQRSTLGKESPSKVPDAVKDIADTMPMADHISPDFANDLSSPSRDPPQKAEYKPGSMCGRIVGSNSEDLRDRAAVEPSKGSPPSSGTLGPSSVFKSTDSHEQSSGGNLVDGTPLNSHTNNIQDPARARSTTGLILHAPDARRLSRTHGITNSEFARDASTHPEKSTAEKSQLAATVSKEVKEMAVEHATGAGSASKDVDELAFEDLEDLAWRELQNYLACESGENEGLQLPAKSHQLPSAASNASPLDWEAYVEQAVQKGLVQGHAVADKLQSLMQFLHGGRQSMGKTRLQRTQELHVDRFKMAHETGSQLEWLELNRVKARASTESRKSSEVQNLWLNEFMRPFGEEGEICNNVATSDRRHILDSSSDSEAECPGKFAYPLTQASTDVGDGSEKNTLCEDVPLMGVDTRERLSKTREDDGKDVYLFRLSALLSRSHGRSLQLYCWNAWRAYCQQIVEVTSLPECAEPQPCSGSQGASEELLAVEPALQGKVDDLGAGRAAVVEPKSFTAKAEQNRFAAEAAAKAEREPERRAVQESLRSEPDRCAVDSAAKAQREYRAVEATPRAETDNRTDQAAAQAAEAGAKSEREHFAAQVVTIAEQEHPAVETTAKAEHEDQAIEADVKAEVYGQNVEDALKAAEAAAKAKRELFAAEVTAEPEQETFAVETATKAEHEYLTVEAAVKPEVDRQTLEAAAKVVEAAEALERERFAHEEVAKTDQQRFVVEGATRAKHEESAIQAAANAEADRKQVEYISRAAGSAAKAELQRVVAEAGSKSEQERLAVESSPKVDHEDLADVSAASPDADRQPVADACEAAEAVAESERDRFVVDVAANRKKGCLESEAADKVEHADRQKLEDALKAAEAALNAERERFAAYVVARAAQECLAVEASAEPEHEYLAVEAAAAAEADRQRVRDFGNAAEAAAKAARERFAVEEIVDAAQERFAVETAARIDHEALATEAVANAEADRQKVEDVSRAAEAVAKAELERFVVEAGSKAEQERLIAESPPKVDHEDLADVSAASPGADRQPVADACEAAEAAAKSERERFMVDAAAHAETERLEVEAADKMEHVDLAIQAVAKVEADPNHSEDSFKASEAISQAERERIAVEEVAKAKSELLAVETASKSEHEYLASEVVGIVEADRQKVGFWRAAEAGAKAERERFTVEVVANAEQQHSFVEADTKAEQECLAVGAVVQVEAGRQAESAAKADQERVPAAGVERLAVKVDADRQPVGAAAEAAATALQKRFAVEPASQAEQEHFAIEEATKTQGCMALEKRKIAERGRLASDGCATVEGDRLASQAGAEVAAASAWQSGISPACGDFVVSDKQFANDHVQQAYRARREFFLRRKAADNASYSSEQGSSLSKVDLVQHVPAHGISACEDPMSLCGDLAGIASRVGEGRGAGSPLKSHSHEAVAIEGASFADRESSHSMVGKASSVFPGSAGDEAFKVAAVFENRWKSNNTVEFPSRLDERPDHVAPWQFSALQETLSRGGGSHATDEGVPHVGFNHNPGSERPIFFDRGQTHLESYPITWNDCLIHEDGVEAAAMASCLASRSLREPSLVDAPPTPGCVRYASIPTPPRVARKVQAVTCKFAKPYAKASLLTSVFLPWALLVCGRRRSFCLKGLNLGGLLTWLFAWIAFQLWRSDVLQHAGENSANEYLFNILVLGKHVYMVLQASQLRGHVARNTICLHRSALKRSARQCKHEWEAGLWQDNLALLTAPRLIFVLRVAYRAWAAGTSSSKILRRLLCGHLAYMRSAPRSTINFLLVSATCFAWRAHTTALLNEMRAILCRQEVRKAWESIVAAQRRLALHQDTCILYQVFSSWHLARLAHPSLRCPSMPLNTSSPSEAANARELHRSRVSTLGHHVQRKASRNAMALAFLVWLSAVTGLINKMGPVVSEGLNFELLFQERSVPCLVRFKVWVLRLTLLQWALHHRRKRAAMEHCCERAAWHALLDQRDLWLWLLGWRARTVDRRRVSRVGQELCNPFHLVGFGSSSAGLCCSHVERCWDGQRLAEFRDALLSACRGAGPALKYNCYDLLVLRVVLRSWSNECWQASVMRRKPRRNCRQECAVGRRATATATRRARLVAAWMIWASATSFCISDLELNTVEHELRRLWSSLAALHRRLRRHAEMRLLRSCMVEWRSPT